MAYGPHYYLLAIPMINDFIFFIGKLSPLKYLRYFFSTLLLYGSLYWISFHGSLKVWFGFKPKFIVTPKEEVKYTTGEIIKGNIQEIIFSFVLIAISLYFTQSLLPVILIVIPSLSGIYLTSLYKPIKKSTRLLDEKEDAKEILEIETVAKDAA